MSTRGFSDKKDGTSERSMSDFDEVLFKIFPNEFLDLLLIRRGTGYESGLPWRGVDNINKDVEIISRPGMLSGEKSLSRPAGDIQQ